MPHDRVGLEGYHAARGSAASLPWPFWACLAAVFVGWFPCDTLTMTVGALRLHFHFFDLASVIARPSRLVVGVNRGDALTLPFGVLCLAAIAAPLAPSYLRHRLARFGPCVPLCLMLACGVILYGVTSGDTFTAAPGTGSIANALIRFGNTLAGHASAVVARHITIGLGVWMSLPAAVYLARGAVRGRWGYADRLPLPTTTSTTPAAIPTPVRSLSTHEPQSARTP
jgi:hypothetical protein